MTATKIQPGDDLHLTSLMAPHSLNFVTGADRAALLAYGRDVFAAGLVGAAPAAVAPLPAVLEQIAQGWDGCKYDAPGETLDIGADIRAAAKRLLAEQPAAVAEPVLDVCAIAAAVCQRVAELPDRNSPEDWPEAMLVTGQELIDVVTCELEQALEAPALEAPAAPAVPAGFALVPIEPTQQMLDAGRWSGAGSVSIQEEWARKEVWSRMLATVTPPPAAYADDLVALVTELVQALRKATPDNDLAGHALDYLKRNGLQESPLRAADTAPQAPAAPWKDHQTARLVNDLRDCAIKYHGAGQLRERIAHIVVPLCDQLKGALAAPAAPSDPMDWPLPCDVTVGHGTIRKGCELRTLVLRMQVLYDLSQKVELAAPAAPAVDALAPVQALLDVHAALLDANPYAYFELAYTRQTGWMAWITDKPMYGAQLINPDRKVLARGQGDTAAAACAAAAQAKEGGDQ